MKKAKPVQKTVERAVLERDRSQDPTWNQPQLRGHDEGVVAYRTRREPDDPKDLVTLGDKIGLDPSKGDRDRRLLQLIEARVRERTPVRATEDGLSGMDRHTAARLINGAFDNFDRLRGRPTYVEQCRQWFIDYNMLDCPEVWPLTGFPVESYPVRPGGRSA
jgi:hypothetical protein